MSAIMKENTSMDAEPYMAFIQDDITSRSFGEIVKLQGWDDSRIFNGGIDLAVQTLSDIPTPELLVIDLTNCMDAVESINELASVCDAGVRLLCLGTTNDVVLYRTLLDMGVEDYLLKPIDPATLEHAVERACQVVEEAPQPELEAEGDVISVVGALGGAGATSLTLNLAWDLSQHKHKRVAVVDLDLHFGTVALSLDLEPGKGFREALENPSRIDSLFLDRAMVKVDETLSILSCETEISQTTNFDSAALDLLIERLRQKFDVVVLDVPRDLLPVCGDMLAKIGRMIVVSDLSLTGMRDSLRISRFAKNYMIDDQLTLVANRAGENKERELAVKEFEAGTELTLQTVIPFDPKGFAAAELQGAALVKVAVKSKAAQAMKPLFDLFKNEDEEGQKTSIWRKLFNSK
ncbi:AAA family ATPase [Terasakiella sp. A23]|uniref:AAA family ATPase n=1 Tax=Terasakiella sp. FCG-A23 TaxID=3080561 RepID=UPI00295309E0|nr:AAA family ATPase [Terasakiella sp. A23]MDV7340374.1 AAA family ATPase [Terasakiella sp. A23]